jgi:glutamate dehydrogenase/leucine dehydrogenase
MVENRDGLDFRGLKFSRDALANIEGSVGPSDNIIGVKADILVFAALGGVVGADNQSEIQASIMLELANGPVDDVAHGLLEKRGVQVIPDIVTNAGGVIVSYLEWQQNKAGTHWDLETVNDELDQILSQAIRDVIDRSDKLDITMTDAAFMIAVERLTNKERV